jgi:ammonia channel protein AmtB
MAQIATGSIAERTSLETYFFYTFLTSSLIFPLALAWCWEDGWLMNLGFRDFAGAGIVHLTGGITGFIGTYLCGARVGLFSNDSEYKYILDEANFIDEAKDEVNDDQDMVIELEKEKDTSPKISPSNLV